MKNLIWKNNMFRLILPVVLIALAISIVFGFIRPQYAKIDFINSEIIKLEEALAKKDAVQDAIKTFKKDIGRISDEDKEKISRILPFENETDPIVIINNINNIAMAHGMLLSSVNYEKKPMVDDLPGKYIFRIETQTKYDSMKAFLTGLENSEMIFDIPKLNFSPSYDESDMYKISLVTYWLN